MVKHTVYRLSDEAKPCRHCGKLTFHYHRVTDCYIDCDEDHTWDCYICDACDEHLYSDD